MTLADSLTVMLSTFVNAFVWAAEVLFATALLLALTALICLALRWAGRKIADKRVQLVEPDNCGDQGGMSIPVELRQAVARPKAPETGSGLLAGAKTHKNDRGVPTEGKVS